VYDNQHQAFARFRPDQQIDPASFFAPYNTHPPPSVLSALPFAGLPYRDAHLAWCLATGGVLLVGLVLAVREAGGRHWWCYLPGALAAVVWADATIASAGYGQPNFLLAGLLALGWVADRRGYGLAAGGCVGLATAIKLFPGLVFVHFLLTGRWKALVAGVLTVLVMNGLAAGLFGTDAFRTHRAVSVPSLIEYQAAWRNMSVNGYTQKLLDPNVAQSGPDYPHRNPELAKGVVAGVSAVVLAVVGLAVWRGRKKGPDGGWAVCLTAMLLLSPITWQHYFVLLVPAFAALFSLFPRGPLRWATAAVALGMMVGDKYYWAVGVSAAHRKGGIERGGPASQFLPLDPAECVGLVSAPFYLTLALFGLAVAAALRGPVLTPGRPPAAAGPSPASAGAPGPSPPPGP
jgi:hypothetical protein